MGADGKRRVWVTLVCVRRDCEEGVGGLLGREKRVLVGREGIQARAGDGECGDGLGSGWFGLAWEARWTRGRGATPVEEELS